MALDIVEMMKRSKPVVRNCNKAAVNYKEKSENDLSADVYLESDWTFNDIFSLWR